MGSCGTQTHKQAVWLGLVVEQMRDEVREYKFRLNAEFRFTTVAADQLEAMRSFWNLVSIEKLTKELADCGFKLEEIEAVEA